MTIVIRLNTGNIKFRQRRPRRNTFVDCQRYVSLLSRSAKLAEEPWVEALACLMDFSSCLGGGGSLWSTVSTAWWCMKWHWWVKENEQEFRPAFFHQRESCQNSKLWGCRRAGKYGLGKMAPPGEAPVLYMEDSLAPALPQNLHPFFFPASSSLPRSAACGKPCLITFRRTHQGK